MRKWILLAATVAMLATPPASAQADSTPTTLYFHVFDTFNKFPINTQPMDAEFFEVGGNSFPSLAENGWDFNTIYGYSTAGPVEYDFIENGRPRFHPERGIAQDVEIDDSIEPVVYLYVDVRDAIGLDYAPMFMPDFTFEVTVRSGDELGNSEALDAGNEIMSGTMTAHLVEATTDGAAFVNWLWGEDVLPDPGPASGNDAFAGQTDPQGVPFLVPDENGIVEFAIPMKDLLATKITKADAFNVRIDWYQASETAGEDQFSTGFFRLAADPEHLPRLELAIKNPVYVEFIHPQVAAGTLLIHTGVNSPWGTYDVDVANMTLTIKDASGTVVKEHLGTADDGIEGKLQRFVSQGAHVHDRHDDAAEITYMWKFRDEAVANGEYTIDLSVPNLAGNAVATSSAKFVVEGKKAFGESDTGEVVEPVEGGEGSGKNSPGPMILLPAALAGAAILRRRRA